MSQETVIVLVVLLVVVVFLVRQTFRIDVVAIMAMLTLAWLGVISPEEARSGFSSNAIVAIIAVMIMVRGLFATRITDRIATFIIKVAGSSQRRIVSTVALTVGVMSSVMQNIGAVALFLPVMVGVSKRQKIPLSQLLMPMGFAALLGGTLTIVGTSSLIVLNDLLEIRGLETFHFFSVTPIGVVLLLSGVAYFALLGKHILPSTGAAETSGSDQQSLLDTWKLSDTIQTYQIPAESPLVGKTIEEAALRAKHHLNVMGVSGGREAAEFKLWIDTRFRGDQRVVIQGKDENIKRFVRDYGLVLIDKMEKGEATFEKDSDRGFIEVLIPARSSLAGKTVREVALRETYRAQLILFFSDREVIIEGLAERRIKTGDTLILHGRWENLRHFKDSSDFLTVTPIQHEPRKPEKAWFALTCFAGSILLVFFSGFPISIGFLTGALAMIVGGVLTIEDAYRAVEWKVIFLIAGLIPIGIAMETSGAATLIAQHLFHLVEGAHPFLILLILGALTTVFSLLMSNVAATVLMVPLVLEFAGVGGLTSEALVLLVGICSANSFIIPTHQVNALLMTPGGYRVPDYLKAGSGLTLLFLLVSVSMIYFFYS